MLIVVSRISKSLYDKRISALRHVVKMEALKHEKYFVSTGQK